MQIIEIRKEDKEYPVKLRNIKNSPKKLYAIGNIELLQTQTSIAIVGSRNCSSYGQIQGFKFANELSKSGITVVSGMALGIDSVAHLAAVKEKGNTIAILGSGFNHIFPKENEYLFYKILNQGGCIISEYPPEEKEQASNFPKRNRIISGLASKVLVVEASRKSGSLITARLAKEQGKEVLAVPNALDVKESKGTNDLILNGATIAICPNQIISKIMEEKNKEKLNKPKKIQIKIPNQYKAVYELLEIEDKYINEISKELKISLAETSSIITMMELEGYVERTNQNQYKIIRRQN